jgi:hypothetical protein
VLVSSPNLIQKLSDTKMERPSWNDELEKERREKGDEIRKSSVTIDSSLTSKKND